MVEVVYNSYFIMKDDVNGLVFDFGSSSARVGYAGEDTPRSSIPSYTTRDSSSMTDSPSLSINEHALYCHKPSTEVKRIFKDGLGNTNLLIITKVTDWQGLETLWESSYATLKTNSSLHPLIMTECSWNPKEDRQKLVELAFEKFNAPAFYLGNDAILSA